MPDQPQVPHGVERLEPDPVAREPMFPKPDGRFIRVSALPAILAAERERLRHQRCIDALSLAIEAKKSYPEMIEYVIAASSLGALPKRIHDLSVLDAALDSTKGEDDG